MTKLYPVIKIGVGLDIECSKKIMKGILANKEINKDYDISVEKVGWRKYRVRFGEQHKSDIL